jgi:glycosyltransferase involved in cell wall biosynthesis
MSHGFNGLNGLESVAVVIPTYNHASSLKRAIESVQAQTVKGLDVIVIDDGSEDGTADVVQEYPKSRYVKIAHSGLPAVVRNVGARMTNAAYLAFLDSDDEWLPFKVERQLRELPGSSFGLVCSNATLNGVRPYLRTGQKHTGQVLKDLIGDNFVVTSSVLVRRDLFEQAGGFCEDPRLRGIEDYDLWLRIAALTDFQYIDEELLLYRHSETSLSRTRSMLSHWQGMEFIFSRVHDNGRLTAILNRQIAVCRTSICDAYLASGQYRQFVRTFAGICRRRPATVAKYLAGGRWISHGLRGLRQ